MGLAPSTLASTAVQGQQRGCQRPTGLWFLPDSRAFGNLTQLPQSFQAWIKPCGVENDAELDRSGDCDWEQVAAAGSRWLLGPDGQVVWLAVQVGGRDPQIAWAMAAGLAGSVKRSLPPWLDTKTAGQPQAPSCRGRRWRVQEESRVGSGTCHTFPFDAILGKPPLEWLLTASALTQHLCVLITASLHVGHVRPHEHLLNPGPITETGKWRLLSPPTG